MRRVRAWTRCKPLPHGTRYRRERVFASSKMKRRDVPAAPPAVVEDDLLRLQLQSNDCVIEA